MSEKFDTSDPEMVALRNEYLETVLEELTEVDQAFIDAERTGEVEGLGENVSGTVHSVKGSAGSFGLPLVTESCHHLEDTLLGMSQSDETALIKEKMNYLLDLLAKMKEFISLESKASELDPKKYVRQRSNINAELKKMFKMRFKASSEVKHAKVLFIDYSKTAFLLFRQVCKEHNANFELDFTADGIEGISKCLEKPYDYVICGNNINRLNGKAIISAVQHQFGPQKPVTVYLSNSTKLTKDFSPNVLLQRSNTIGTSIMELIMGQAEAKTQVAS